MPPRTKQNTIKKPTYTRDNPPPPIAGITASYPWPCEQEGILINVDDPNLLDLNVEGWDKEMAREYNALLNINILPTRFVDSKVLSQLVLDIL
ncbi:hypothetical protein DY000_02039960 [Brassica cretica]|uniref:Uncharacterized protein n=1 Tax=Brassica cretica TaxID=69181 RepID=A0ABQ7B4R4_BRACR|nr:hypothetical protein DY000_02039960 [Brassica cretica]